MALSPVEKMAHHPVRETYDDTVHWRGQRNGIALVFITLQEQRRYRAPHGVREDISLTPRAGLHFLLPERGKIVDVIAEAIDVPTVRVRKHAPGQPLSTVVDDQHIEPHMDQVVGQFGVFNVAFNTPRADHDDPIIFFITETNEAYRDAPDARKRIFLTLAPEIGQRPHGESSKCVFSCFPVLFLLKHWVSTHLSQGISFFRNRSQNDSTIAYCGIKTDNSGVSNDLRVVVRLPADIHHP